MAEPPADDALADLLDHHAIAQLHARYGDVVTRRAWRELAELFTADMPLELDLGGDNVRHMTGPGEIGDFLDVAVARFDFFEFVPVNAVIDLYPGGDRDAATARFWIREDRHTSPGDDNGDDNEGGWSTAFGLYRDTYRRIDGCWWFSARRYRSLARTGVDEAVLPFPDLD